MTLARAVVVALLLAFAPVTTVRAQADPLQEANQLFRQGQLDRAMERVNNFLSSHPKDARGRFLKGLILTEQNKPDDAIKVFAELSQDYPELPEPYNNLAVLYASQGVYDKARNALESAIRTHPSYATAHENLGDIYAKMASQAYDKALQLDRSNQAAQTKLNLIKELFSQGTRAPEKVSAATSDAAPAPAKSGPPQSSTPATPPSAPAAAAWRPPLRHPRRLHRRPQLPRLRPPPRRRQPQQRRRAHPRPQALKRQPQRPRNRRLLRRRSPALRPHRRTQPCRRASRYRQIRKPRCRQHPVATR